MSFNVARYFKVRIQQYIELKFLNFTDVLILWPVN